MAMRDVQAAIEGGTVPLVPMPLKVADQKAIDHMRALLRFYTEMAQNDPKQEDYWKRCRLKAAKAVAPYETPRLQAVLVEAPNPKRELAGKSDLELLEEFQAKAAAVGIRVTIEPLSKPPQLTVGDGGKQDEGV
jgi:hypothetical protein